jgi:oxygen-independent coproporphyrinogen-3 oxidase
LHIPFCSHRCAYCDFNTVAGLENLVPAYTQALCQEIQAVAAAAGGRLPVETIFFGGGTPSLLTACQLEQILVALRDAFDLSPTAEISLEANPGTLSPEYLRALRQTGLNRLSLGVQSANPFELHFLERQHDYPQVIQSVAWARRAGFDNLNLDLIFGLPGQELASWQHTLELALGLQPEHFSLYSLTIEHGTPLEHWSRRGLVVEPDPDQAADMYEWASQRLEQAGYIQYEISNWAKERQDQLLACRHNLQYWRGLPYLGLGAGAHGYAAGHRTVNVLAPTAYIQRLSPADQLSSRPLPFPRTPATQSIHAIDRQAEMGEFMFMGLRLVEEGVAQAAFLQRFGQRLEEAYQAQIDRLVRRKLLEWAPAAGDPQACLRLTKAGRLLGNQAFIEFV